jgi:hypothetical protein
VTKTVLLAAASIIVLCAGASASGVSSVTNSGQSASVVTLKQAKLLWNQNSNDANSQVDSQNFTGGSSSSFSCQGADDFVIPKGRTWAVTEVDVTGKYFNGSGPATSENIVFYKDTWKGMPGKPVRNGAFTNLNGIGGPDFAMVLPGKGLKLKAGHYWVSVIANVSFNVAGEWGWEVNGVQHGDQAMWQNPGGAFHVCQTWGTIEGCANTQGPDFMFDLRGTSKGH